MRGGQTGGKPSANVVPLRPRRADGDELEHCRQCGVDWPLASLTACFDGMWCAGCLADELEREMHGERADDGREHRALALTMRTARELEARRLAAALDELDDDEAFWFRLAAALQR